MPEEIANQAERSDLPDLCSMSMASGGPRCGCLGSRGVRSRKNGRNATGEQVNGNHAATSDMQQGFRYLAGAYGRRNRFSEAYRVTRKAGLGDLL